VVAEMSLKTGVRRVYRNKDRLYLRQITSTKNIGKKHIFEVIETPILDKAFFVTYDISKEFDNFEQYGYEEVEVQIMEVRRT
jgi:hypothetical protein